MEKKTIRDIDVRGKRVLVREDLNVPLDKKTGQITDDTRIRAALPTVRYLIDHAAKVIVCSHLGRPDGKVVDELRMAPVAARLSELVGKPVKQVRECAGPEVEEAARSLAPGDVLLLENLRFYPGEEKNDPDFARALASLADVYVNDAFGTAHRAHASTAGVAQYLPAVAGLLMEKEISFLGRALTNPARPFAAVIGGAKVSTKIAVLNNLLEKVDVLLIGGGMANTFLKAEGYEIGKSLVEDEQVPTAKGLIKKAEELGVRWQLPIDVMVADKVAPDAMVEIVSINDVPADWQIVDIGPRTVNKFWEALEDCKTVLWNGPMGIFEVPRFAEGTRAIADTLSKTDAVTIVGGGESVAAVEQMGYADKITHISTGGGASLEFLEGRVLPGVAVLQDKPA